MLDANDSQDTVIWETALGRCPNESVQRHQLGADRHCHPRHRMRSPINLDTRHNSLCGGHCVTNYDDSTQVLYKNKPPAIYVAYGTADRMGTYPPTLTCFSLFTVRLKLVHRTEPCTRATSAHSLPSAGKQHQVAHGVAEQCSGAVRKGNAPFHVQLACLITSD